MIFDTNLTGYSFYNSGFVNRDARSTRDLIIERDRLRVNQDFLDSADGIGWLFDAAAFLPTPNVKLLKFLGQSNSLSRMKFSTGGMAWGAISMSWEKMLASRKSQVRKEIRELNDLISERALQNDTTSRDANIDFYDSYYSDYALGNDLNFSDPFDIDQREPDDFTGSFIFETPDEMGDLGCWLETGDENCFRRGW